ncbi:MAG: PAS domain-containing protein [Proteobacteria bacterium]|nr:PAS domain-containing protein [Pseudomonadota bacterium]
MNEQETLSATDVSSQAPGWGERVAVAQYQLLGLVAEHRSLAQCLEAVTAAVAGLHPGTRACILLADETRTAFAAMVSANVPQSFGAGVAKPTIAEPAIGICDIALHRGEPMACADIAADPDCTPAWRALCLAHGIYACYAQPVMGRDNRALASLMLCFSEPRIADDRERQVAGFGARIAALAIEQAAAERRREVEDTRQQQVFEQAPGFICTMSGPDHVFTFVNAAHRRLFNSADWIGKPAREAFPEGVGQGFFELLDKVYATGVRYTAHAAPIRQRPDLDGAETIRLLDFVYAPIVEADGQVSGIFCEGQDVTERVRAEELVRRNNETFSGLIHNAPFGVYVIDADFRLVHASQVALRAFGLDPLIGLDLADALRAIWQEPFASEAIGRFRHTLATGEPYVATDTVEQRADRNQVEAYDWRTERIVLPDGQFGVVCYFYDLTERQRFEAEIRRSEERLRALVTASNSGYRMNADWTEMTELDGAGVLRDTKTPRRDWLNEYIPEEDQPEVLRVIDAAIRSGTMFELEHHVRLADGSLGWTHSRAVPIRNAAGEIAEWFGIARDATERKKAELALARSEEFSRRILASSNDCIKVLGLDGRLESLSEGGTRRLQITNLPALLGQPWTDIIEAEDRQAAQRAVLGAAGGETRRIEVRTRDVSGQLLHWDSILTPIMGHDGHPEKVLVVSRDTSERMQAEAETRRRNEQLQRLAQGALAVARAPTLQDTLEATAWAARMVVQTHQAVVALKRGDDWRQASVVPAPGGMYAAWRDDNIAPDGSGIEALVCETNQPLRLTQAELEAHPRWQRSGTDTGGRPEPRGWLAAPLIARDGHNIGFIQLTDKQDGSEFDGTDEAILTQLAQIAAAAIEQTQTEEALRRSEQRMQLAQAGAQIGVWDWDSATNTITWTPEMYALLDVDPDTPADRLYAAWFDNMHPEDRQAAADQIRDRARDGEPFSMTYRIVRRDGQIRWIGSRAAATLDATGRPTRITGVNIDITAQRAVEDRLRGEVAQRTRERDRLFELSQDLFAIAGLDGALRAVNPAWSSLLGYTDAELLAMPGLTLTHPADRERAAQKVARLRLGEPLRNNEDRVIAKNGAVHWISWTAVPDLEAGLCYVVGRDVTQDRAREEALRQSQKMEAVGHLTGGIAHDFNNLLQGLVGSLDLIRRKPDNRERVLQWAEAGMQAAERGTKLTGQLLAFARSQKLETKPVAPDRLITAMQEMLARTLGPTVVVQTHLTAGPAQVLADEVQLEMALLNLAINARDAMDGTGNLSIATRTLAIAGDSELADGDYVEITVSDKGSGMSPEVLARVFDPFFTTKGVGKGTGLGLSQVYGSVRQAGGAVRIDSEVGRGTTVRLLMPCTAPGCDTSDEAMPAPLVENRAAKVVVIDDDPSVRQFLSDSLDLLGYHVAAAEDGPTGITLIDDEAPDLVVVDFAMPGMTGAEVARILQARWPALPIVFASGYAETNAIEAAAGADALLLRKPFKLDDLQQTLEAALSRAQRRD